MFNMNDFEKMNNSFKEQSNALDEEQKLVTKKLLAMDDLEIAIEYIDEVFKLFDSFSETDNMLDIIKKLYSLPYQLSSLVMIPVDDIREIKSKILAFVKSYVPGGVKTTVSIELRFTVSDLEDKYSDIISDREMFVAVSNIVYYLQIIQVWFSCKYVMEYEKNKVEEDLK